jgi:cytochrome c-type biogenesis protein CcmH/NrfG
MRRARAHPLPGRRILYCVLGRTFAIAVISASLLAFGADLKRAEELYQRTEYTASLQVLSAENAPDARTYALIGKNYYMLGNYKKAIDAFQMATALEPASSDLALWLGRTYGRRAEIASPLLAPGNASKARQYFEKAVELDPHNNEALNDLFDYYLEAPSFLGGGMDKAEAMAKRIGEVSPAEYHFAEAQLADRKKEYDTAEEQLRRAIAKAPEQVGRVIDLAKYLAKRGRYQESDATFQHAAQLAPDSPNVIFAEAHAFIYNKRRLDDAKALLEKYVHSNNLTPDDPPREEALKLLKQIPAGA